MMKVAAAAAAVIITLLVAMIETLITHYHDYSRQSNQQPTPNAPYCIITSWFTYWFTYWSTHWL